MRTLVLLVLVLSIAPAGAEQIYKTVGPDGSVSYSDQPNPGAKPVHLPQITIVPATPAPASSSSASQADTAPGSTGAEDGKSSDFYQIFAIVSPEDHGTLRSNQGIVEVRLDVKPKLRDGDKVQIYLDGVARGDPTTSLAKTLSGVPRGAHSVAAAIVGAQNQELAHAGPVTFFMHHASLLIPPPKNAAPRAPQAPAATPAPNVSTPSPKKSQ